MPKIEIFDRGGSLILAVDSMGAFTRVAYWEDTTIDNPQIIEWVRAALGPGGSYRGRKNETGIAVTSLEIMKESTCSVPET